MMVSPAWARLAVSAIFFVNGAVLASWVAHIPAVKTQHGLSDDRLGLVLLSYPQGRAWRIIVEGDHPRLV